MIDSPNYVIAECVFPYVDFQETLFLGTFTTPFFWKMPITRTKEHGGPNHSGSEGFPPK